MIRLGGLFPDHLNLNGDIGNLEVLSKQLSWRGIENEITAIQSTHDLDQELNFILIGHGSVAAWQDVDETFSAMLPQIGVLKEKGVPCLSVSSGFERLAKSSIFTGLDTGNRAERVSKFEVLRDGDAEVLGYLNTDLNLPTLHRDGQWIGTMLHGPVLAKNPELLDELLASICASATLAMPPLALKEKADQLAGLVQEIWNLERDLAGE